MLTNTDIPTSTSTLSQGIFPAPQPSTSAVAKLVNGVKIYDSGAAKVTALNNVSIEFGKGEFTSVMGPSGSGKSTLMHAMAGLDRLTSGHAYIGDVDISTLSNRDLTFLRRDRIGFIFQAFNLIASLNAEENITLPLSLAGKKADPNVLREITEVLGISKRLHHRPSELSGGQQQRIAVARALVAQPDIVFADEPTGNLDSRTGAEILGFMRDAVKNRGQSTVMVTHDPVAASYSDRVVFFVDGSVHTELRDPTPDSVLDIMRELGRH